MSSTREICNQLKSEEDKEKALNVYKHGGLFDVITESSPPEHKKIMSIKEYQDKAHRREFRDEVRRKSTLAKKMSTSFSYQLPYFNARPVESAENQGVRSDAQAEAEKLADEARARL